jgi:hypothetical protein
MRLNDLVEPIFIAISFLPQSAGSVERTGGAPRKPTSVSPISSSPGAGL